MSLTTPIAKQVKCSVQGGVTTTVQTKLNEIVSVIDYGAVGNGVTNDSPAITSAVTALTTGGKLYFPAGNYLLNTNVAFTSGLPWQVIVEPNATFTGAGKLLIDNLIVNQITPISSIDVTSKSYSASGTGNIFQKASYVKQSGTTPTVAVFGEGDSAGGPTWGGNFVGTATTNVAGSVSIAAEINPVNTAGTTAKTFGIVVAAAGSYPSENAFQMQVNNGTSTFKNGFVINNGGSNPVSGSLIKTQGSVTCSAGIDLTSATFSTAAITTNGFTVNPSGGVVLQGTPTIGISIDTNGTWGIKTTGTKTVGIDLASGTHTNAAIRMKAGEYFAWDANSTRLMTYVQGVGLIYADSGGTSYLNLWDSGRVDVVGPITFSGTQMITSRQTGWGTATGASRAAFNGSTASLAQTSAAVAALINDLTTHGLIGA